MTINKIDASSLSVSNSNNNNANVNNNGEGGNSGSSSDSSSVINNNMGKGNSPGGSIAAGVIVALVVVILLWPVFNWVQACILERSFIKDGPSIWAILSGTYKSVPGIFYPFMYGYKMKRNVALGSRGGPLGEGVDSRALLNGGKPTTS